MLNCLAIAVGQTIIIANHMIVVVAISFPSVTALLKLVDDLARVFMLTILFIWVVLDVVLDMSMGHQIGRRFTKLSRIRHYSANQRIWVNEGVFYELPAICTWQDVRSLADRALLGNCLRGFM